jgi:hypothetical protein
MRQRARATLTREDDRVRPARRHSLPSMMLFAPRGAANESGRPNPPERVDQAASE